MPITNIMKAAAPETDQAPPRPDTPKAHLSALTLYLVCVSLFWRPLVGLATLAFHDENSSHILFIPLISGFLLYLQRKEVFRSCRSCPILGMPLLFAAIFLQFLLQVPLSALKSTDRLAALAALLVLAWMAIFLLCYGVTAFKAASFPLFYLCLMIPLPVAASDCLISFLQKGSADVSNALFHVIGVPVLRHGFQFSLPGMLVEVAEQCSGIHSAISLLIAGLLAAHFVLDGLWRKLVFVLCILPIAIIKNAVRIVTLAWIGIHINPAVFQSRLHRQGCLPFSLVALAMMAALLWLLRYRFSSSRTPISLPC
jgi:exosortase